MTTGLTTAMHENSLHLAAGPPRLIEIRIREVKQLFNSMDPSPFNERDLDRDADEYIVNWAHEYSLNAPLALRVHLEEWPADDPTPLVTDAVHHYFTYRAGLSDLEFRRIMREGRMTLAIGLVFLAACLVASQLLIGRNPAAWAGYVRESLTIAGWVAMWKPMETYLYEWWPVRRRGRVFKKLSVMPVEVVQGTRA
jgi:hypothetical protein